MLRAVNQVGRTLAPAFALLFVAACGAGHHASACPHAHGAQAAAADGTAHSGAPSAAAPSQERDAIEAMAATRGYTLGSPQRISVLPDGDVLFLRTGPRSLAAELFEFDAETKTTRKLASAADLLSGREEQLSAAEKAKRERTRTAIRGITSVSVSTDGTKLLLPLGAEVFVLERATMKATVAALGDGYPDSPSLSPDGSRVAFVRDQDLWVADLAGKSPTRLTKHESPTVSNGSAEFVAQEELDRTQGYWWSPGSDRLMYQRTDEASVDTLYVSNPASPADAPTAFRYPRAGTPNAEIQLGIVSTKGGKTTWIDWDRAAFPYLRDAQWPRNAAPTLVVMNRAQTEARVLTVDVKTGKTTALHSETDKAWINVPDGPRWSPDGTRFYWATERTGEWTLEVHRADGSLEETITSPGFDGIFQVDDERGEVFLSGSVNPTENHVTRAKVGVTGTTQITTAPGVHRMIVGSKGGTRVLESVTAAGAPSWTVLAADGSTLASLDSAAASPPAMPSVVLETVEVSGRTHHAAIVRPRDFDATRRYPIVLRVYAGPGVTTVWNNPRAYMKDQLLADAGFVVVRSDGRGTPRRGRAWERAIKRDVITTPIQDQVDVLTALGARHAELDLTRVGVVGWSFGGYFSAMAALLRPDIFKAAIAGAPVTDWRYYDTAYTERYMGLPGENAAGYDATSAVVNAAKLTRPLLLVHGLVDDNVYVVNTLAFADALFRAGKDFDLLTLGSTHMVVDPAAEAAMFTRQVQFFRRHLGTARP
jgi:dipeptidyl-peptidase-4